MTFGASALPSGFLVDRLGARRVLLFAFLGAMVGALLIAVAPGSYALGVLLALTGLCAGLYHPAGLSLIARWADQRALALSYHGVAGNVGMALAPVTAVSIAAVLDWRAAFVFLALLCAVTAALMAFVQLGAGVGQAPATRSAVEQRATGPRTRISPVLVLVYGVFLLNGFIYRGSLTFLPSHIEESARISVFGLNEGWLAGSLTTLALFAGAGGQLVGGALSLRFPLQRLAPVLTLLLAPLLALIGFASGPWLALAAAGFVFANFSNQPVYTALIAEYSNEANLGRSYGVGFFLSFGLGSSAATAAGAIADTWDVAAVFRGLSIVAVVAAGLAVLLMLAWARDQARTSAPAREA